MAWINKTKKIKYILITAAIVIAAISLVYSHFLVKDLEKEAGTRSTMPMKTPTSTLC